MAQKSGYVFILRGETIEKVNNQSFLGYGIINVCQKICNRLHPLTILGNGEISKSHASEFIVKLNGPSIFLITKKSFETNPHCVRGRVFGEGHSDKRLGQSTV